MNHEQRIADEKRFIASLLLQWTPNGAGADFLAFVNPEHFGYANHRTIIEAMKSAESPDAGILAGKIGRDKLVGIASHDDTGYDLPNLYRFVKDHWINHELGLQSSAAEKYHGLDRLKYIQTEADRIEASITEGGADTAAENFVHSMSDAGRRYRTGIPSLDRALGEIEPSEKIVIGAMRSGGKTSLAANFALNMNRIHGASVGIYSAESPDWQIMRRILANKTGITIENIKRRFISESQKQMLIEEAHNVTTGGIAIYSCAGQTASQIAQQMLVSPHEICIVDHMQKFRGENLRVAVGDASGLFATVADRKGKVVVMCSQLNREPEKENRQPRLSDLKEAGDIEQDADTVILIHNDPATKEQDTAPCELVIAKRRDGGVGICNVMWNKTLGRFYSEAHRDESVF